MAHRWATVLGEPFMACLRVEWDTLPPEDCRRGAVTVGNFDGVHRGHAALVAELRRRADAAGGHAVALTFDPHPLELLRPELALPPLSTMDDRCRWLRDAGADHVVVLHTTAALLGLTAADFFKEVLQRRFEVRALVEGTNFGFGRGRGGNVGTLAELCAPAGVALTVVPPVMVEGQEVSSSRVRAALPAGAVEEVGRLLGRPYRLHGTVGRGAGRGRLLNFPTANLEQLENLAPGDGVYAVRVEAAGKTWAGAANVGPNPTFGEKARKVEVHLIDFAGDLYGAPLAVDFVRRLRDTRPFGGAAELAAQLGRDVEQARQAISPLISP
jgi:riboflavin kinase/FMN adenylyltransferase